MNPWIKNRRTPEVTKQIVAEYRAGATGRALAAKYGCVTSTIYRILEFAGVKRRPSGPPERVNERLAGDPTPEQIAERAAAIRKTWGHIEGDDDGDQGTV